MTRSTGVDIGNTSALIIERADSESEEKLIKTNKKDKEYRKNRGFRRIGAYSLWERDEEREGRFGARDIGCVCVGVCVCACVWVCLCWCFHVGCCFVLACVSTSIDILPQGE